jgi:hypothetical protein
VLRSGIEERQRSGGDEERG